MDRHGHPVRRSAAGAADRRVPERRKRRYVNDYLDRRHRHLGSAAGLIAAVLGAAIWLQVVLFFIVSIAALIATRPLVKKLSKKGEVATNADRVLGGTARVTETIDNTIPSGEVYIDGKTWTARSQSGAVIAPETLVTVIRLEGVKLYVDVPHNV